MGKGTGERDGTGKEKWEEELCGETEMGSMGVKTGEGTGYG